MTVVDYNNLRTRCLQVRNETAGFANTETRIGSLFQDIVDSLSASVGKFNVATYIAAGTGSLASPAAAFAAADAAAALVGGIVYVPAGTYGNGTDWAYAQSSGVTLEGDGAASVLVNCHHTLTGTVGAEIPFTAPAAQGAYSLSIPATGLSNAWLRIASCINSNSTDAGANQLGDRNTDLSMLAEFVRVLVGGASTATLYRGTCFDYSNTPGGDSGTFTTSAARVVTFNQGSRVRNIKYLGKNSSFGECLKATWCRDLVIENVFFDANDQTAQMVNFEYCLDSKINGGRVVGKLTSVPTGSPANQVVFISCQNCSANGVQLENGNQSFDVTYSVQSTYRGGPSIDCGASDCSAIGFTTEGFTSHPGCLRAFFDNCETLGGGSGSNGIRIRSRGDRVTNCRLTGFGAGGSGVLIMETALFDSCTSGNRVNGFTYGIEFQCTSANFATLRSTLGGSVALITKNTVTNALQNGIALIDSPALATNIGPRVLENDIHSPGTHGINVGAYINGTVVDKNRVYNVPATRRGIIWTSNIKRLYIGDNFVYGVNATGFGMGGPSVANFLTDAVTFPAGNAEAFLYIGELFTDAATPTTGILQSTVAYDWGYTAGYGGNQVRTARVMRGTGTPEGNVFAPIGATYERTDGGAGTSHYFKETNATLSTGWVAK